MNIFKKFPKLLIPFIVLIVVAGVLGWMYFQKFNANTHISSTIITGEEKSLSAEMRQWINETKDKRGVYMYVVENDTSYELVLSHKEHLRNDLYIHSVLNATFDNGLLKISIDDRQGDDDTDIQYNLKAYVKLNEKPQRTEVYVNGKLQFLNIESGNFPIFAERR